MGSLLDQLQQEIKDRLLSDPFFSATRQLEDMSYATITVCAEDENEIESVIEKSIANIGVAVIIAAVTADVGNDELPGPYFDDIKILVQVGENVVVNRGTRSKPSKKGTLKKASEIAEMVHSLLHHWVPDGISTPLRSVRPSIRNTSTEGMTQRDLLFTAAGGLSYVLPQVATPVLTDTGANKFTASCATAGAAIFYTINGRHPSPRSATLYTGEVTLEASATVKARAWLAGYRASEIASLAV